MVRGRDALDSMRRHPAADWTISDIRNLCHVHGIACEPPTGGGSHYKLSHPAMTAILTVPFRRPIKPVYIRMLVRFIDELRMNSSGS